MYSSINHRIPTAKEKLQDLENRLEITNEHKSNATLQLSKVTQQLPQSERRLYQEDLGQQFKLVQFTLYLITI